MNIKKTLFFSTINIFMLLILISASVQSGNPDLIFHSGFEVNTFGQAGSKIVATPYQEPTGLATIYYPTDASAANKVPVVFLSPGWDNTDPNKYKSIMNFIASHGVAVIFAQDRTHWHPSDQVTDYVAMINDANINSLLDTTRIGVIGHSLGGGHTFSILDLLSDAPYNYGENGRFLFVIEPWFAFDMMQADMLNLPVNTNVIFQQYGVRGYNDTNDTDPRIPLTEFYLMESIADNKKDYQVYNDASLDHYYPYDNPVGGPVDYSSKQVILAPLDALMQYTFVDSSDMVAHNAALEVGNDDPWNNGNGIQIIYPHGEPHVDYPCNGSNSSVYDIDFCDIKGYPYTSQFNFLATNDNTIQPTLGGMPTTEAEFGTNITRLTVRETQTDMPTVNGDGDDIAHGNYHLYPKVQGWNSDMTMYRLGYRLYDANTHVELSVTSSLSNHTDLYNINGSLNEIKWSTKDPNIFYGVSKSWDHKGQFWKATIDKNTNPATITKELIRSFGVADTYTAFTLGKYEGNIDYNEEFVVFAGRKIGGLFITLIVYDLINNTFIEKDFDGNNGNALINWTDWPTPQEFDWASVSALGNHIIISTDSGLYQYDINLNYIGQLTGHASHGDMGVAQNGEEVFVQFKFTSVPDPQAISAFRLQKFADGEPLSIYRHRLLPSKYNGGHISCRNYQRPGWCYLSTNVEGHREVTALRINFSDHSLHVVNRFAQTHTLTQTNAFGGVSPDGKKIMFVSDWEQAGVNYYDRDTYQAQMPD